MTALPVGFPMPRDLDGLADESLRVRLPRPPGRRYPMPVPNGWFVVATSAEVLPGEIVARSYFGRSIVVYRGESGEVRVTDAHCPHLGAHLAVGGKVEGDCIRCPFHGWRFDGESGSCVEIPYGGSERIPAKARLRSYPTVERNHMVWAWHHLLEEPPFYDVPEVPEFHDPDWHDIVVKDFRIAVSVEDMAENNVDFAHFPYVHGTDSVPDDEFVTEGTYKRTVGRDGMFVREGFGLGLGVLRVTGWMTFLSSTTPVDEENVHVRWVFTAPRSAGPDAAEQAAEMLCAGVSQDIPIWENKVYREHPVLTKSERPILEQRLWARQFYSTLEGEQP
jgi:phenylpropionate dioxygenase-like ring-hydroxylating dioxygenase large terminal subunit